MAPKFAYCEHLRNLNEHRQATGPVLIDIVVERVVWDMAPSHDRGLRVMSQLINCDVSRGKNDEAERRVDDDVDGLKDHGLARAWVLGGT